jgi:hypothetical protein
MFDIFGFWVSVSVLMWALLVPVVFAALLLLNLALSMAIPKDDARKIFNWIVESKYNHTSLLGGKVRVHDAFLLFGVFGIAIWIMLGLAQLVEPTPQHIYVWVAKISTFLAPVFGWVGIILGLFFSIVLLLKYGYKASIFATEVKGHMSDKRLHK